MLDDYPLMWRCDMCREMRLDAMISVISYTVDGWAYAKRNLKYCNDREDCRLAAISKAKTGIV